MRWMAGLLWLVLVGCSGREPPAPVPEGASSPAAVTVPPPAAQATPAVELVMDVMQVVGRSEAEVSELLGAPVSCQDIHRARLCRYPPDGDEVMFVAGKADMISVHGMGAVAFNQQALGALGLAPVSPDQADDYAIRWQSIPGLEEVTVFAGPGNSVDYAYVKVGRH